jgi:hypothetical protein
MPGLRRTWMSLPSLRKLTLCSVWNCRYIASAPTAEKTVFQQLERSVYRSIAWQRCREVFIATLHSSGHVADRIENAVLLLLPCVYSIARCSMVSYLATLWPSKLQYHRIDGVKQKHKKIRAFTWVLPLFTQHGSILGFQLTLSYLLYTLPDDGPMRTETCSGK